MDAFEARAKARGSVLISLATRGAARFYEHRGNASKAAYYKKYLTGDVAPWLGRRPARETDRRAPSP